MTRVMSAVIGSLVLLVSTTVSAIPVPTTPSAELIINFDFFSPPQTPAPPYDSVSLTLHLTLLTPSTAFDLDLFDNLNGSDFLKRFQLVGSVSTPPVSLIFTLTCTGVSVTCTGQEDGIFSLGLVMTAGAADFVDASAIGTVDGADTSSVAGQPVPEPAALTLLGAALLSLGVIRHRRRRGV